MKKKIQRELQKVIKLSFLLKKILLNYLNLFQDFFQIRTLTYVLNYSKVSTIPIN